MGSLKDFIGRSKRERKWAKLARKYSGEEKDFAERFGAPQLTKYEIAEVDRAWGALGIPLKPGYDAFRGYKQHYGFDAQYVPFAYYFPYVVRVLNPIGPSRLFADKSMAYTLFHGFALPALVARKQFGAYSDCEGALIAEKDIAAEISREGALIKPTSESGCGRGVKLVEAGTPSEEIIEILRSYPFDCIIQKVLVQSSETAAFNKSSLNTFRISTLFLNGRFSVLTAMLRFGLAGSVVDNVGAGGACAGIDDDGVFMPYGFTKTGEKITEWNGLEFKGYRIENFSKIIDTARKAHARIPMCAFVGWDLALDKDGNVNIIESNVKCPRLFFEQLANARPVFRDRFDEVLDFVQTHPLPLSPEHSEVF